MCKDLLNMLGSSKIFLTAVFSFPLSASGRTFGRPLGGQWIKWPSASKYFLGVQIEMCSIVKIHFQLYNVPLFKRVT